MPHHSTLHTGDLILMTRPFLPVTTATTTAAAATAATPPTWWTQLYLTTSALLRRVIRTSPDPPVHLGIVLCCPTFIHPCLQGQYLWHAPNPASPQLAIEPLADVVVQCHARGGDVRVRRCIRQKGGGGGGGGGGGHEGHDGHDGLHGMTTVLRQVGRGDADDPSSSPSEWRLATRQWHATSAVTSYSAIHWPSAFVAYAYVCCGMLDARRTLWRKMRAEHFAQATEGLWYASGVLDLSGGRAGSVGSAGCAGSGTDNVTEDDTTTTLAAERGMADSFWMVGGGSLLGREQRVW